MRDNFFREDENELPYLVSSRRDDSRNYSRRDNSRNINFKDVPFTEFPTYVKLLRLPLEDKVNLINSVEIRPGDCRFSIRQDDEEIMIDFEVENKYLKTEITVSYSPVSHRIEYRWGYVSHDGLESLRWFRNEVALAEKETGLDYDMALGGFRFSTDDGKLIIKDEMYVSVIFSRNYNENDSYEYRVDFEKRKLIQNVLISPEMYLARFLI